MPIINTNSQDTSFSVNGLTNGAEYVFKVAARNSTGIGPYSNMATATPSTNIVQENTLYYHLIDMSHLDSSPINEYDIIF